MSIHLEILAYTADFPEIIRDDLTIVGEGEAELAAGNVVDALAVRTRTGNGYFVTRTIGQVVVEVLAVGSSDACEPAVLDLLGRVSIGD